jgi:ArsR family transcriptional regulator
VQRVLRLLSDPTRLRILAALDDGELAVGEIAEVLGMSQSRISNHLRILRDGEVLRGRREGAWTFYRNALPEDPGRSALWKAVREGLLSDASLRADAARRRKVVEERRRRSRDHFAGTSNGSPGIEAVGLRAEILAAAAPSSLTVVDAGCGDGALTELLAERFDRVIAVDHSPERLEAARARVDAANVSFRQGEVDGLPLDAAEADLVFLSLVLHHVPEIPAALREAHRVLRPGGKVVVADLAPHQVEEMRERMGDFRLGIEPRVLGQALADASFEDVRVQPLRERLRAGRHPPLELFLATGRRPAADPPRNRRRKP